MDQYTMLAMQQAQQQQAFLLQQQQQLLQQQQQAQQVQAQQQFMPYPMAGIDYPGMNDVMCGRGGGTNNHIGNIRFRQLVNEHKLRYLAAPKVDKPKVAMEVVQIWRRLDPPGRFLTKTDASAGDDSLWHDVGDKKAREKASQCLRERTPDVMPFVKQLQEQERKKKEEEKRKKEGKGGGKSGGNSSSNGSVGASSTVNAAKAGGGDSSTQNSVRADTIGSDSLPAAETVSSSIDATNTSKNNNGTTRSEATPDVTVSSSTTTTTTSGKNDMGPPLPKGTTSTTSGSKKSKSSSSSSRRSRREDLMDRVPTAAALSEQIFGVDDGATTSGLSLEAYQSEMQEFLENAPKGALGDGDDDDYSATGDRSLLMMETMSANSWVRSFQSIGSQCDKSTDGDGGSMMMMSISESLRDIDETTPPSSLRTTSTLTNPNMLLGSMASSSNAPSSRSQKLKELHSISMLSDLTDISRTRSTRSSKLQGSKAPSNFSMLSELTDLSEGMKEMDLHHQQNNNGSNSGGHI